ncbi:hypothetical protein GLU60_01145 [Nanohaloarchaea archaeon H01]|nr:hypothetical protein [Nanohaloarchaea archaeon H01]
MNVPNRVAAIFVVSVLATVAAIMYYPSLNLIQYVIPVMQLGFAATVILTAVSIYREEELNLKDKNIMMNGFILALLIPSFYAAGAFVHQSQTSWSGGEIHWHADFEVIVQEGGEYRQLDLIDPGQFCKTTTHESELMCELNDRTGSTKYHEHNDDRIHLEGIFKEREDATLAAFFETFDGELSDERLIFPTNNRTVQKVENGETPKVLVHKGVGGNRGWCAIAETGDVTEEDICTTETGEYATSPSDYVISPFKRGPSLDDIFVVYDSKTTGEALQDVREDDLYEGMGITKEGEGF